MLQGDPKGFLAREPLLRRQGFLSGRSRLDETKERSMASHVTPKRYV